MMNIKKDKTRDVHLACSVLKYLVNDRFPCLSFESKGELVRITGTLSDPDWHHKYDVELFHSITGNPEVYIRSPKIKASPKIHMYSDGRLCLFYPGDLKQTYRFTLAFDILPWTIKWIHFYEIYLRNGNIWIGPEAPHGIS